MNGNKPYLSITHLLRNLWKFGFVGNLKDSGFLLHAFDLFFLPHIKQDEELGLCSQIPQL